MSGLGKFRVLRAGLYCLLAALAGCGGDLASMHSVGGEVSGLAGTGLVLQNNGADDLAITGNGHFIFKTDLFAGAPYAVTVKRQPGAPAQTCAVSKGSGRAGERDIADVRVTCVTDAAPTHAVGGTVDGLLGSGLVLQNNGGDDIGVAGNGSFAFRVPVAEGSAYAVTVKTQPDAPQQLCTVKEGSGTVGAGAVASVAVSCVRQAAPLHVVGGTVSGLAGSQLVLQNNGADDISISANGRFAFPTSLADGAPYIVAVKTTPSAPPQSCTVAKGSGVVNGADVTDVAVDCVIRPMYTVGGTVAGLNGSGLTLQNNGEALQIAANGRFVFTNTYLTGTAYAVAVKNSPAAPAQTCTIDAAAGTIAAANVTEVKVTCQDVVIPTYSIGGTVSGLLGTGLVLQNTGNGEVVPVSANGSFVFATQIKSGVHYDIAVKTQPGAPQQTCMVSNGSGSVAGNNVANIAVLCPMPLRYSIGGTVSGLRGTGMVLQNADNGETLAVAADGSFSFATQFYTGTHYNVAIKTQPGSPQQTCTVSNGAGNIAASNVGSIAVTCPPAMHYAYVSALSSTRVFKIDDATGALTPTASVVPLGGLLPGVHPAGSRLFYLADTAGNAVRGYALDAATGALAELPGSPFATGGGLPQAMTATPDGRFLYVLNRDSNSNSVTAFAIDAASGVLTPVGVPVGTGTLPLAANVTPDGKFLFVANYQQSVISRYAIDAATGALNRLGDIPTPSVFRYMAIDGRGRFLYATSGSGSQVYAFTIDAGAGLTGVPGSPFFSGAGAQNVAADPGGRSLYVTNETDGTLASFAIDAASGALTTLAAPLTAGSLPEGVVVDPNGKFAYAAGQGNSAVFTYQLDPAGGAPSAPLSSASPARPLAITIVNQ